MKHLSELLERRNQAEIAYRSANGSMDSSPLEVVVAKEELNQARFIWNKACSDYILEHVLNTKDEVEA